jgi:two-component system, OmpR family, response regulator
MTDKKTRILHVEDDRSLQNLVRITLERLGGYSVRTAADGFQALELGREFGAELILLDLDLPGQDGAATLQSLRQVPSLGVVPAIFLTADASAGPRLMTLGAAAVLAKPFRPRELLRVIERALAGGTGS